MFKIFIVYISILLFVFYSTSVNCQQKYEKESRLNHKDVPSVSLEFINTLEIKSRVKWYYEEGLKSKTIEAKFKYNNKRHSVEFDTIGNIQDIEIKMMWKELPSQLKHSIHSQLNSICSRHKISKIQVQYSGSRSILLSVLKNEEKSKNFTKNYEIIAKCVNDKKTELFEYLFSNEGKLLESSLIIFKNSSNLEY